MTGHSDLVNVAKFFHTEKRKRRILLSGAADKTIRVWCNDAQPSAQFREVKSINDHSHAINTIAVCPQRCLFVSGSADATLKIWKLTYDSLDYGSLANEKQDEIIIELQQSIDLQPKFLPLAVAVAPLPGLDSTILAVAGTKSTIQIFVSDGAIFKLSSTLAGHEGWIRSLDFIQEPTEHGGDILLASASQDKFVRLWRLHQGTELPTASAAVNDPALGALGKSLSNKAHKFESRGVQYSLTFEALLLGHEDWIYSARWRPKGGSLQLLTASADNSLAIWQPDPHSGLWICSTRLGEISAQKGATTATGSTGGFWTALWSPEGNSVVSLGRTGSWRLWRSTGHESDWIPRVSVSGHVKEVQDLAWSRDGSYLLSTSSDQTTRLFARWNRNSVSSWHEFSRPQIHGYDLNCIDMTNNAQFISGADEKLLRVFDEPRAVANLLETVCGIEVASGRHSIDAANIPVLGLSNKAIDIVDDNNPEPDLDGDADKQAYAGDAATVHKITLDFDHPPLEDHLSRHLLWPETEKLYGHGYEISAVAASHDGSLVATACKASSVDHAVIRLYETKDWREIKPALTSHSLTVTSLAFSPDDRFLLSTGRDRKWTVFVRSSDKTTEYRQISSDPKGHSRMVLAGRWASLEFGHVFATAGRDKSVKFWSLDPANGFESVCKSTISAGSAVTALDFLPKPPSQDCGLFTFSYGTEEGKIIIHQISKDFNISEPVQVARQILPSKAINQLRWQPSSQQQDSARGPSLLAAASDDSSVRLYSFANA